MLCPFRLHTVEYQRIIGKNEKGDIVATVKDEFFMPCQPDCCCAELKVSAYGVLYEKNIKCRRLK